MSSGLFWLVVLASAPALAEPATKWDTTLYGFIDAESIADTTQGLSDGAGNAAIARPDVYAGHHDQMTFSARNSRIGLRLAAPTTHDIKATAQLEVDFRGSQPTGVSDAINFASPTLRVRHMNLKIETPIVDVLLGQSWRLFGWQGISHPNSVESQGLPGEVFARVPQIRVSKRLPAGAVTVEAALAAVMPGQRAGAVPDVEAGLKLSIPSWSAWHTTGASSSSLDAAAIGVSAISRRFAVDEFSAKPVSEVTASGHGISFDALVPILPASKRDHGNALTATASYATGRGIADMYGGLTGGVAHAALPSAMTTGSSSATYTPNIDPGLAVFTADGVLHPVQWTSYFVGAQYYLPGGDVWFTVNYAHLASDNAHALGSASKVFDRMQYVDACAFWNLTPAVRLGLQGGRERQSYVDGVDATNYRFEFAGFYLF